MCSDTAKELYFAILRYFEADAEAEVTFRNRTWVMGSNGMDWRGLCEYIADSICDAALTMYQHAFNGFFD